MSLHRLLRLKPALAGLLLVMIVATANAGGPGKATVKATGIGYVRMGQNSVGGTVWGTRAQFAALWEPALGGSATRSITRAVPISSTTIGSLARRGLRGGLVGLATSVAFEGILDGAGWAINELQTQVVEPEVPRETMPTGATAWCFNGDAEQGCSTTPLGICTAKGGSVLKDVTTDFYQCRTTLESVSGAVVGNVLKYVLTAPREDWGTGSPGRTIPDEELGEALRDSPQLVDPLLRNPVTGAPVMTPELTDAVNDLRREIEAEHGLDPSDDLAPVDDGDDSIPDRENGPGDNTGTSDEWPGFCSWATVVCDFIDWVKAPEPESEAPETPFEEEAMPSVSWSSGLGGGSCPSPYSTSVSIGGYSQSIEFSVQPICDFGTTMHPLVVALALLLSPMIIGGFRSSKDA